MCTHPRAKVHAHPEASADRGEIRVEGKITEGMSVRHSLRGCGTVLASFKAKQAEILAEPAMDFHAFSQLFDSEEDGDAHVRYLQYQLHLQQQQVDFSGQTQHTCLI